MIMAQHDAHGIRFQRLAQDDARVGHGAGGLGQLNAFFDRLQQTHDRRIRELGLS